MILNYLGFHIARIDFPHGQRYTVAIPFQRIVGYAKTLREAKRIARTTVIA